MSQWLKRRPAAEVQLFGEAVLALNATRLALHTMPLAVLKRRVWRALRAAKPLPIEKRLAMVRVLRVGAAAARFMPVQSTCLATALVMQALLSRHGYPVQLRIGVKLPAQGKFAAHAWLEHDGKVIVGGPASVVDEYHAMPGVEQLIA